MEVNKQEFVPFFPMAQNWSLPPIAFCHHISHDIINTEGFHKVATYITHYLHTYTTHVSHHIGKHKHDIISYTFTSDITIYDIYYMLMFISVFEMIPSHAAQNFLHPISYALCAAKNCSKLGNL